MVAVPAVILLFFSYLSLKISIKEILNVIVDFLQILGNFAIANLTFKAMILIHIDIYFYVFEARLLDGIHKTEATDFLF